ncbi:MAG: FAD-dependent oxidoreductase, partial [Saprospiraceae bacterium]
MSETKKTDVLIVGAGISGLTCAINIAIARPELKVTVVAKANKEESNTRYAQGGIAAVWNEVDDTLEKHVLDTLDAGDGLCKEDVVRMVVTEGPI